MTSIQMRRLLVLVPAGAALVLCLAAPPRVAFEPQRLLGLALVVAGLVAALVPCGMAWRLPVRGAGMGVLWAVVAWCALSQPVPLDRPVAGEWGARALPIAVAGGAWLFALMPRAWQRRAAVALTLPTVAGLGLVVRTSPPRPLNFSPYYVAVDSRGTLYVAELEATEVRVFAPDGSLTAKLQVGRASTLGPPGPGFSPPGPLDDPLGTGVCSSVGPVGPSCARRASAITAYDFAFCGIAVDGRDRLWMPDLLRGTLLRFASNGRLELRRPLPPGYHASRNCVAASGDTLYLSDDGGAVYTLGLSGDYRYVCALPERIPGGVSVTPDGARLYALSSRSLYSCDIVTGRVTSWRLPPPRGDLGMPYQAPLALPDGRIVVTDLAAHRLDVFTRDGLPHGTIGARGELPGQFGQVGGLARDAAGNIYVADQDSRVVQRFTPAGRIAALYWSPEDDEID